MRRLLLITLSVVALPAASQPEMKGTPEELRAFLHPQKHQVTLTGEAEETAYTDLARVSLRVTTEEKSLAASLERNEQLRRDLVKGFVAAGVAAEDIKSAKFSTSPQYGWFGKKPDSYKVTNRLEILVREAETMQVVAGAADQHDEVAFADTTFEHSDKEALERKVREQALADVKQQQAYYEKELGLTLKPIRFHFNKVFHPAHRVEEVMVSGARASAGDSSYASKEAPAAVPTSFDEVEYKATVHVDFEVVQD